MVSTGAKLLAKPLLGAAALTLADQRPAGPKDEKAMMKASMNPPGPSAKCKEVIFVLKFKVSNIVLNKSIDLLNSKDLYDNSIRVSIDVLIEPCVELSSNIKL